MNKQERIRESAISKTVVSQYTKCTDSPCSENAMSDWVEQSLNERSRSILRAFSIREISTDGLNDEATKDRKKSVRWRYTRREQQPIHRVLYAAHGYERTAQSEHRKSGVYKRWFVYLCVYWWAIFQRYMCFTGELDTRIFGCMSFANRFYVRVCVNVCVLKKFYTNFFKGEIIANIYFIDSFSRHIVVQHDLTIFQFEMRKDWAGTAKRMEREKQDRNFSVIVSAHYVGWDFLVHETHTPRQYIWSSTALLTHIFLAKRQRYTHNFWFVQNVPSLLWCVQARPNHA